MNTAEAVRHANTQMPNQYTLHDNNPSRLKNDVSPISPPLKPADTSGRDMDEHDTNSARRISQLERVGLIFLVYGSIFLMDDEKLVFPILIYVVGVYLFFELVLFIFSLRKKRD